MRPTGNLHLRMLIPYSITLIVTIALAWWIATTVLTTTLERRLDDQLSHATAVLADGDIPFTDQLLQRFGKLLRAEITLITPDGHIGATTLPRTDTSLRTSLLAAWRDAPVMGQPFKLEEGAIPYRLVIQNLNPDRDSRYAAVAALASLDDVHSAAGRAAWLLGIAAVIGTLALSWVGHQIVRSLTIPIKQLSGMAEQIAAGDRNVRAPVDQHNELGTLARALDTMTGKLDIYEQEIAEQNRLSALGEMAARIAHEIRNPLTAIKMQIELLGESRDSEITQKTSRLLDEIRRLELIVSTTLASVHKQNLQRAPQDLNRLVDEVAELMTPQLEHRDIRLERLLEKLPASALDSDKVKQVLFNLLSNSIDALPKGGGIRIHTRHDTQTNEVILEVEDTGGGLAPGLYSKLFKHPVDAKEGGLGVGLMLCRELVELHGGTIRADSSPALGGAIFTVRFPVVPQEV